MKESLAQRRYKFMDLETYDKFSVFFFVFLALVLFYQSWMNLAKKQLTNFSMDALVLLYLRVVRGKAAVENAKKLIYKEPSRLRFLGIAAFCCAITAMYVAVDNYQKYFR
jgi:hypothetical protein